MRVVFFGYHGIGCACLRALVELGAEVPGVFTHRDDPAEEIWFPSMVGTCAELGLPSFTPENPNSPESIEILAGLRPDLILSVYYRKILSERILALAPRGALNLHGSLLPRYRGRCPVNWVLIHGERETGVTLHHMVRRADAGDIVAQRAVAIDEQDTARTLFAKLERAGVELLREIYPRLVDGTAPRRPQDESRASTFGGRRPADGRIDWKRSAAQVHNLVRAVTHPYPGAFTTLAGRKVFLWQVRARGSDPGEPGRIALSPGGQPIVQCASGHVELARVQTEGEPELDGAAWLQSMNLSPENPPAYFAIEEPQGA